MTPSRLVQIGGIAKIQSIIDDFIDRTAADLMIGFYFRHADLDRIKELEAQLAGQFLGGRTPYEGRPLPKAHGRHKIFDGHFSRRIEILKQTLDAHGIDTDIRDAWLAHNESLRHQIVGPEPCHGPGEAP